jgi:hypothetical protein
MKKENFIWVAIKTGLLGGVIAIFINLVGMVEIFSKRDVIEEVITLGQFVLLATSAVAGFIASRRTSNLLSQNKTVPVLTAGLTAGLITGSFIWLLVIAIGDTVEPPLRTIFLNASPALYKLLTFGEGTDRLWILPTAGAFSGLISAAYLLLPESTRRPINRSLLVVIFMALFSGLFRVVMINQGPLWTNRLNPGRRSDFLPWRLHRHSPLGLQRQGSPVRHRSAPEGRKNLSACVYDCTDRLHCPGSTFGFRSLYRTGDRYGGVIHLNGSGTQYHTWVCWLA